MHEKSLSVYSNESSRPNRQMPPAGDHDPVSLTPFQWGQKGRGLGLPAKSQVGVNRKASPTTEEGEQLGRQRRRRRGGGGEVATSEKPRASAILTFLCICNTAVERAGSNQQAVVPDLPPPICVASPALCLSLLTCRMEIMTMLTSQGLTRVGAGEPGHRTSPATVRQGPPNTRTLRL